MIQCLLTKKAEDIVYQEMGVVANPGLNFHPFVMTVDGKTLKYEPKIALEKAASKLNGLQVLMGMLHNSNKNGFKMFYFQELMLTKVLKHSCIICPDIFPTEIGRDQL